MTLEEAHTPPVSTYEVGHYDRRYAEHYILQTLSSAYNLYKNKLVAKLMGSMGFGRVVDIGCNVSGIVKREGSLRYQLELLGIQYTGVDVNSAYFKPETAKKLGVPDEEIYDSVDHCVASVEDLPFEDHSLDAIVCADVIEHVPDPERAFGEIARTLKKEMGRAAVILPSMYKLDLFDFEYIDQKRYSSHEHKLSAQEWEALWEGVVWRLIGKSRPVGIASGLSYLAWMNDDFVPERADLDTEERHSEKSMLHRKAKEIFAKYDSLIDPIVLGKKLDARLVSLLQKGNVHGTMDALQEIISKNAPLLPEEKEILDSFFATAAANIPQADRIEKIRKTFEDAAAPSFLLGNSILLALRHQK